MKTTLALILLLISVPAGAAKVNPDGDRGTVWIDMGAAKSLVGRWGYAERNGSDRTEQPSHYLGGSIEIGTVVSSTTTLMLKVWSDKSRHDFPDRIDQIGSWTGATVTLRLYLR